MRFLLVNNNCISDPTAGAIHSLRTIMKWLAEAGHACHILTTSRFECPVTFSLNEHLEQLSVPVLRDSHRPVVHYSVGDVPVTLLLTEYADESKIDLDESRMFMDLVRELLDRFSPDQLIACNGHPMILASLAEARARGMTTAFGVRGFGYYDSSYFDNVNHVFTCSEYLTSFYREKINLLSTPLEPPLDWSEIEAPAESRAFVTFVHPAPHKGLMLFARLADMLGSRRPDIPILVVQSGRSAGILNSIDGIDFSKYPQIMAAPPVQWPAEYFALTRILLVPSVWNEPFGRVAAEAMINGIPAIVSDRGFLPTVVGGDFSSGGAARVLPIPEGLTSSTTIPPSEEDVEPWYRAVCEIWDDPLLYQALATRARRLGELRYSEEVSRQRHLRYFESLNPDARALP